MGTIRDTIGNLLSSNESSSSYHVAGDAYELNLSAWDADDSTIWGQFPRELAKDDSSLYKRYEDAYFTSPLATLLVDHLASYLNHYELVPGPEGSEDDVDAVREHFRNTDAEAKLQQMTLQTIILGTGTSQLVTQGESVDDEEGLQLLDTKSLNFRAEEKLDGTFEEEVLQNGQPLDMENVFMMRLKQYPGRVSGVSMMTSVLFSLEALNELIEDIPAAVKQLAYVQRVAKLDMEGYDTEEAKNDALESFTERFRRFNSAKSTVMAIDKRNDVGYMGTAEGQSAGQQRMMPINDLIEPLVSWTMLNFNMGLGHILQTGSNKALLNSQEDRIRIVMNQMQDKWAQQVERQYIDKIVGENRVRIRHLPNSEERRDEKEIAMREFKLGVISADEYRERFQIRGDSPDENRDTPSQPDELNPENPGSSDGTPDEAGDNDAETEEETEDE